MNKISVQSLNEYFNVCGEDFIWIDDTSISTNWNNIPWNTGTKGLTTNSPLQRQIARKNALKRNEKYKGANNPRAKTWKIVYNDGREIVVGGLQRWAVDNGYSTSGIKNIAYGKWKTYKDLVAVEEVSRVALETRLDPI